MTNDDYKAATIKDAYYNALLDAHSALKIAEEFAADYETAQRIDKMIVEIQELTSKIVY